MMIRSGTPLLQTVLTGISCPIDQTIKQGRSRRLYYATPIKAHLYYEEASRPRPQIIISQDMEGRLDQATKSVPCRLAMNHET